MRRDQGPRRLRHEEANVWVLQGAGGVVLFGRDFALIEFGVRRGSDVERGVDEVLNLIGGERVSIQGNDRLAGANGELRPPRGLQLPTLSRCVHAAGSMGAGHNSS